jgi:hypothetical protein
MSVPEFNSYSVSLDIIVRGSNSELVKSFPKTDTRIRLGPGSSGLRQKRQCTVPTSYEGRQENAMNPIVANNSITLLLELLHCGVHAVVCSRHLWYTLCQPL